MFKADHRRLWERLSVCVEPTLRFEHIVHVSLGPAARGVGRRREAAIDDLFENAASMKVDADDQVDHLDPVKGNGECKILNVLRDQWQEGHGRRFVDQGLRLVDAGRSKRIVRVKH